MSQAVDSRRRAGTGREESAGQMMASWGVSAGEGEDQKRVPLAEGGKAASARWCGKAHDVEAERYGPAGCGHADSGAT